MGCKKQGAKNRVIVIQKEKRGSLACVFSNKKNKWNSLVKQYFHKMNFGC